MTTKRAADYFRECKRAKAIIAAGGYYCKKGKFRLHTGLTFAEQRKEFRHLRIRSWKEYKPVLQFPEMCFEFDEAGNSTMFYSNRENTCRALVPMAHYRNTLPGSLDSFIPQLGTRYIVSMDPAFNDILARKAVVMRLNEDGTVDYLP